MSGYGVKSPNRMAPTLRGMLPEYGGLCKNREKETYCRMAWDGCLKKCEIFVKFLLTLGGVFDILLGRLMGVVCS